MEKIKKQLHRLLLWDSRTEILFINGTEGELIDNDSIDFKVNDPFLRFKYKGENEEEELYLKDMKSAKWDEEEYHFRILMKNGDAYNIECYTLEREEFPE